MDALVYEDHPLASYLEGHAIPCDSPRDQSPPHSSFAPTGLPEFKNRLNKLRKSRISLPSSATEQLLDKFRYVIVASQLLSEDAGAQVATPNSETIEAEAVSLKGVLLNILSSFLFARALYRLKTQGIDLQTVQWTDILISATLIILFLVFMGYLVRRKYTQRLQKTSIKSLSSFVDHSHLLDTTVTRAIRFIQEVELVARGYGLNSRLPPISRLENGQAVRRCRMLRTDVATTLRLLTLLMVEGHNAIQSHIDSIDLQRYYDIYEISLVEYESAVQQVNQVFADSEHSLKDIRFAVHFHSLARKVFLCDLLALKHTSGLARLIQWNAVLRVLREIGLEVSTRKEHLVATASHEEWGSTNSKDEDDQSNEISSQSGVEEASENPSLKARLRRFEDVAQAIRALNAKVHLIKEEMDDLTASKADDSTRASNLAKHYEVLGSDIRGLVVDWEKGRNALLLDIEGNAIAESRLSQSTSSDHSTLFSPSLGGTTIVDGGPAEALRLLNGDSDADSVGNYTPSRKGLGVEFDEQVFEAVAAKPARKRMSVAGLTREEKIAKLEQDRRKRATLQEQADNTTSMLRELQMVIKHRPRGNTGTPSQRVISI